MSETTARSTANSEAAFSKATQCMPGGVSSPVRAFKAVGGTPVFIREAEGSQIRDIDGNEYIDYVGSYGPMIAGHANERVVAALSKAIGRGTSFGAPTEARIPAGSGYRSALAGRGDGSICQQRHGGGDEPPVRLARAAATGRDLIVKCIGCYHGHVDGLLVEAGSGALTLGTPSSPGIPKSVTASTLLVHYNDLAGAKALFEKQGKSIACFVVEPVAGNMGVVPPAEGYLKGLAALCNQYGALYCSLTK